MTITSLLAAITPTNLKSEKERFFADPTYNPQFSYIWQDPTIKLFSISPLKKQLFENISSQDHFSITSTAKKFFETEFNHKLNLASSKIISEYNHISNDHENVEQLVETFKKALQFFKLEYQIKLLDHAGFNIRPQTTIKQIQINRHLSLQFFDVAGEVRHEMSHIIRYENWKHNKIAKSSNYLKTEEGLAAYLQDYAKPICQGSLFQHAAEYQASRIGESGSFRDVYNFFIENGFNPELAWQRTARHKFGFVDTAKVGDIIKPAMYFAYQQDIKALHIDQIYRLFVGKVSINDLPSYPEYFGKFALSQLEDFYQL